MKGSQACPKNFDQMPIEATEITGIFTLWANKAYNFPSVLYVTTTPSDLIEHLTHV